MFLEEGVGWTACTAAAVVDDDVREWGIASDFQGGVSLEIKIKCACLFVGKKSTGKFRGIQCES